ncbi:OsmC family peroxiredoxin [Acinetobacter qingfengensis]|uniref:Peroxiredoxin n=1 Tax=Acinetobacter qingfengensis TaxID=1262585 RepID=A0A1E7RCQ4_9GAMM|nr:OsmC family protein [Acinetobacter qingfengensis]KAA8734945.1 OsmC family peroxiredoxin [Acinetobacter qingfengensis]OEY97032.1 peroxiredoxin [Acinetobacter qingfengensis]
MKQHLYRSKIEWTGNSGLGTKNYTSYQRSHNIIIANKPIIQGSSDPAFRGDNTKHNPEDLFLSSISFCHMLWYLHFCSINHIIVEEYTDIAEGIMLEENDGKGYFKEIILHPNVIVKTEEMIKLANELHEKANEYCFIANSLNVPVKHLSKTTVKNH